MRIFKLQKLIYLYREWSCLLTALLYCDASNWPI